MLRKVIRPLKEGSKLTCGARARSVGAGEAVGRGSEVGHRASQRRERGRAIGERTGSRRGEQDRSERTRGRKQRTGAGSEGSGPVVGDLGRPGPVQGDLDRARPGWARLNRSGPVRTAWSGQDGLDRPGGLDRSAGSGRPGQGLVRLAARVRTVEPTGRDECGERFPLS